MNYFKIRCRKTFLFVFCFFMVVFTIGVVSCTNDVNEDSIADKMIRQLFLLRVVYL